MYTTATVPVNFATVGKEKIENCDQYLGARTGRYEWRAQRYRAALDAMVDLGLCDTDTIFDVGAGWTEFDYTLRSEYNSRARYIPVDGCIDGVQIDEWTPPRQAEFFVALELIEHMHDPERLVKAMQAQTTKALVISTPNTNELGEEEVHAMDSTHFSPICVEDLQAWGFRTIHLSSFYGREKDSLLGVWKADDCA